MVQAQDEMNSEWRNYTAILLRHHLNIMHNKEFCTKYNIESTIHCYILHSSINYCVFYRLFAIYLETGSWING